MAYTTHGQPIWGTPVGTPYFGYRRNCGGFQVCETCERECREYHSSKVNENKEEAL